MGARSAVIRDELQQIPGVGPSIARDLRDLGIRKIGDLNARDPQEMYDALCALRGVKQDRCVLYVFRCAVYYAENSEHEPKLLKWWVWKDDRLVGHSGRRQRPGRRPRK